MGIIQAIPPLFEGEDIQDLEDQITNFEEHRKLKRSWENAFQKWSNEMAQDGTSPLGCCGYGSICDYCTDNDKGRPCVRALNAKAREMRIEVDYNDRDFERWFYL